MIELVNCTLFLINEISMPEIHQKNIAKTYALAIMSSEKIDWKVVNKAIISRWSISGLERIKKMGWKIIEKKKALQTT